MSSRRSRRRASPLSALAQSGHHKLLASTAALYGKRCCGKSTSPCLFRLGLTSFSSVILHGMGQAAPLPTSLSLLQVGYFYCCTYTLPWDVRSFLNPLENCSARLQVNKIWGCREETTVGGDPGHKTMQMLGSHCATFLAPWQDMVFGTTCFTCKNACLHVCLCITYKPGSFGGWKRELDPLDWSMREL